MPQHRTPQVAVLIPCYNEEASIAQVVHDFGSVLPGAAIYVYNNNSTDRTSAVAAAAGAIVRNEWLQGKGNVVRRMFADVDADIYVMTDGDSTYDAASAETMVQLLIRENLDMVVGARTAARSEAFRRGHRFGNQLLTATVTNLFGKSFTDMLSGYRVFSRRFVKSFPALSDGFETETELTVHALELRLPVAEIPTPYNTRVTGSNSKLKTYSDGFRILRSIFVLYKNERPLKFFGVIALAFAVVAVAISIPVFITYTQTGLVPRLPTALLATGLMLMAGLSLVTGVVLDTVTRGRRETRRLAYLTIKSPQT